MTTLFNGWVGVHWILGEGQAHRYSLWCRLMYSYDYLVLANPPPVRPTSRAAIREGCGAHCGGPRSFPMLPTTPNQLALAAWPAVLQKQSPNCSQQLISRRPPAVGVVRTCRLSALSVDASQAPFGEPPAKAAATGRTGRLLARALPPLQATGRPLPPYSRCQWREGRHPSRPRRRPSMAALCMPF